jgi:glucose/arabinose dehydrogenase
MRPLTFPQARACVLTVWSAFALNACDSLSHRAGVDPVNNTGSAAGASAADDRNGGGGGASSSGSSGSDGAGNESRSGASSSRAGGSSTSGNPGNSGGTNAFEDAGFAGGVAAECVSSSVSEIPPLALQLIATGLEQPIYLTQAPGDATRLFVIEKPGRIRVIQDGVLREEAFLDLTDRVESPVEEMGLLGLVFHPHYQDNGLFYVTYSSAAQAGQNPPHTEVLAEFAVSPGDPSRADSVERRVLTIAQPEGNHNGGQLQFGPDGLLYLGLGDGGGGRDTHGTIGNGQALDTLLGKMLRIDVDARSALPDNQYGIPSGNYSEIDSAALPEIWSVGLRNPSRFSFDACNGDLYIGDVGQEAREEVDFHPAGQLRGDNFGWRLMEAETCFNPDSGCDASALGITLPIASYPRTVGQCITGGYVYRGLAIPALRGAYLYADYESAAFFALRIEGGVLVTPPVDITTNINPRREVDEITSFGQDNAGELYVVSFNGQVFRIDAL